MLPTLEDPELVFGICAPIGTKTDRFVDLLRISLGRVDYGLQKFKVTKLMQSIVISNPSIKLNESPLEHRYDSYINYANKIRELTQRNDALATLCCTAIKNFRRTKRSRSYIKKQAYVFDQFKREEEITSLRQVYGRSFLLISLYSDPSARLSYLVDRIASDHASSRPGTDHEALAKGLIKRDQDEEGVAHGQRLRAAFAHADLFLNMDDESDTKQQLDRFLDLFFGSNKISPTRDEYGMYMAKSASLRSLDLSRQVGAAIFSKTGDVISMGCNDVPAAHGGLYWHGDPNDFRDYKIGHDENERIKRTLLADVVRRMHTSNVTDKSIELEQLVSLVMAELGKKGSPIREAQVMDLLEFGRMIHAEMAAITDAARLGRSVDNATLFCTTFPCHICTKHIISSGIDRMVYIEPYPKSFARQLHGDAIEVEAHQSPTKKIVFQSFIGVSPVRFRDLFERGKRKLDDGSFQDWKDGRPQPIMKYTVPVYIQNETAIVGLINKIFSELAKKKLLSIR